MVYKNQRIFLAKRFHYHQKPFLLNVTQIVMKATYQLLHLKQHRTKDKMN